MLNFDINEISEYVINTVITLFITLGICLGYHIFYIQIAKSKRLQKWVKKDKKHIFIIHFITGAIFSLFSLIFFYNRNFNWSIFLFGTIALSYFFSYSFFIANFIINVVLNATLIKSMNEFLDMFFNQYYLIINIIIVFSGLVLLFCIKYIKWRNNFIFLFINTVILLISMTISFPLVLVDVFNKGDDFFKFSFCFNFLLYLLISYIVYAIIHLLNQSSNQNYLQYKQNIKYKNGFLKDDAIYTNTIPEFITTNNINQGIILKFFIFGLNNLLSQYGNSYIKKLKQQIYKNIINEFKKDTSLFFLIDENSYYLFLKMNNQEKIDLKSIIRNNNKAKRTKNDYLMNLENSLSKINRLCNEQEIYCSITAIASFYGIANNDVAEICKTIENYKLKTWPYMNSIYYDSLTWTKNNSDIENKNKLIKELNVFKPDSIFVNLKMKNNKQVNKTNKNYYDSQAYSLIPYLTDKKSIWNISKNLAVQSALICHTSAKAIIEFKKKHLNQSIHNILILDYPQYLLEQKKFDLDSLLNNITFYGLGTDQFVLNIYMYHQEINDDFMNNLEKLSANNIRFKFMNFNKKIKFKDLEKTLSTDF